jgi:uncharacterized protein
MVEKALDELNDVDTRDEDGYTPLHAAAENGCLAVLHFLLERGAEVNPCMASGETPLDLAIAAGHKETAEVLRRRGATTGFKRADR